jgi:hypothetical protein
MWVRICAYLCIRIRTALLPRRLDTYDSNVIAKTRRKPRFAENRDTDVIAKTGQKPRFAKNRDIRVIPRRASARRDRRRRQGWPSPSCARWTPSAPTWRNTQERLFELEAADGRKALARGRSRTRQYGYRQSETSYRAPPTAARRLRAEDRGRGNTDTGNPRRAIEAADGRKALARGRSRTRQYGYRQSETSYRAPTWRKLAP